jgi:hypothetical protein
MPYWLPTLATLLIAVNADRRLGSLFRVLILAGLNGVHALARRLGVDVRSFAIMFLLQFALLLLKRNVPIIPFDLSAAVFLASLCWLVASSGTVYITSKFVRSSTAITERMQGADLREPLGS